MRIAHCCAGRNSDAAEHRPQGNREILQRVGRPLEPCDAGGGIDCPPAVERVGPLQAGQVARLDGSRHHPAAADRPRPVRAEAIQTHDQRVARHCALDIERAGLRVAARRATLAVRIDAIRADAPCLHGIARRDAQDRIDPRREIQLEVRGLERMCARLRRPLRKALRRPFQRAAALRHLAGKAAVRELPPRFSVADFERDNGAGERAFERLVAKRAGQLVAILFQHQSHRVRQAEVDDGNRPRAGYVGLRLKRQ